MNSACCSVSTGSNISTSPNSPVYQTISCSSHATFKLSGAYVALSLLILSRSHRWCPTVFGIRRGGSLSHIASNCGPTFHRRHKIPT